MVDGDDDELGVGEIDDSDEDVDEEVERSFDEISVSVDGPSLGMGPSIQCVVSLD